MDIMPIVQGFHKARQFKTENANISLENAFARHSY